MLISWRKSLLIIFLQHTRLMLLCHHVPVKDCRSIAMIWNDFRGIAISSAISKVFELGILDRLKLYFDTKDNQFGFKKGLGCSHAIYSPKHSNQLVKGGSNVNLCALDRTKAFDKTNHHALFIK